MPAQGRTSTAEKPLSEMPEKGWECAMATNPVESAFAATVCSSREFQKFSPYHMPTPFLADTRKSFFRRAGTPLRRILAGNVQVLQFSRLVFLRVEIYQCGCWFGCVALLDDFSIANNRLYKQNRRSRRRFTLFLTLMCRAVSPAHYPVQCSKRAGSRWGNTACRIRQNLPPDILAMSGFSSSSYFYLLVNSGEEFQMVLPQREPALLLHCTG